MNNSSERAFSLVEVVISLGVVSFAILSMIALLPMGLTTFHDSSEIYYSAQARQQILNNLQQSDIGNLLTNANPYVQTNYYDGEGSLVGTAVPSPFTSTTPTTTPVYQVAVTVSTTPVASASGATTITVPESQTTDSTLQGTPAATLINSVLVTTQFGRYQPGGSQGTGFSTNTAYGGSTYRKGTDYLFYRAPFTAGP